ncbi:hypothetical protein BJV74DRAFT_403048 [Russula compacta]|nr:hypothetical protein BJV74DRAFT_403048 [Russula compacta]
MASYHLDIPQITVVSMQDDFNTSSLTHSHSSFDASRMRSSTHVTSPTDDHAFLCSLTPILKSARNSLYPPGAPLSCTFDASSPHPPLSPTLSSPCLGSSPFATSTALRDSHPEDYDILPSSGLLAPSSPSHRQMGSIGTVSSIGSTSTEPNEALNDPGISYNSSHEVLDHVQLSTVYLQSVNVLPPLFHDGPTSLPASSCILTSPDKLHPTLSSWLKNMHELSGLMDHLQELASSAPPKGGFQLLSQVAMLRATFKNQQDR